RAGGSREGTPGGGGARADRGRPRAGPPGAQGRDRHARRRAGQPGGGRVPRRGGAPAPRRRPLPRRARGRVGALEGNAVNSRPQRGGGTSGGGGWVVRGASRASFGQARDTLTRLVTDDPGVAATVGDELFAVTDLLDHEPALRRALADPTSPR